MPRIVGHTVAASEVAPLFCRGCSDDVNRDLSALTVEDMEEGGFTSASCSLCGTTFYQSGEEFSPGDDVILTGYRGDPRGTVEDYDEENDLYRVQTDGGVSLVPPSALDPDPWTGGYETTEEFSYDGTPVEVRIRVGNEASGNALSGERKVVYDNLRTAVEEANAYDEVAE